MEKMPAQKYELIFGGNRFIDCGTTIRFMRQGIRQELVRLRTGGDGKLLVNCRVKDQKGQTIASIHNSKIVHVARGYDSMSTESSWLVENRKTGQVYFEMKYLAPGKIMMNGIFWFGGRKIVADDDGLHFDGASLIEMTFDNCGGGIDLG